MGYHPVNLLFRFILELVALVAMSFWGWTQHDGLARYALALMVPLLAATIWGIFNVPGDHSRSGDALVAVPGMVRLAIEAVIFGFAVWALFATGAVTQGRCLAAALVIHYALSWDRNLWLLRR